jgi:carboxypeptidase Taq
LLDQIAVSTQVDDELLRQFYPEVDQWNFGIVLLQKMGFDYNSGRQDRSEHPFTTNFSCQDVRITTRIDEQDLGNMTYSTIHELGHALYEQGLPADQYGLPLGEYASLGIHESQSRLWENNVGRSLAWAEHFLPVLQQYFPSQLGAANPLGFYKAVNKVTPSLIRTEADELTYHFHVMIRYEIEKQLIEGSLAVRDIPGIWEEKYRHYLGIKVPDDRNGCLQDVHWSHGSFGYFPTYSLGSLYAAQLYGAAAKQIPGLESSLKAGEYGVLREWLRVNLHQFGREFSSEELCRKISGEGINISHFMQYVTQKYRLIYALETEEVV